MGEGLLDLCEKYFGARDFYDVMKIPKNATEKQIKKAYHKLSLLVHPDRVDEDIKEEATEKFKVLGRIHSILSENDKRKIYDETGEFDDDSESVVMRNWSDYWRSLFKEITIQDINNYEKNYKGSETEIKDLKRAYLDSKGDMNYILEAVPFTNCEEEPRLHSIIRDLIEKGEVPEYKQFTEEDEKKRLRRKRRWEQEAKAAEDLDKMRKIEKEDFGDDLALSIINKNKARAAESNNFFDSLINKYAKAAEKPKKKTNTRTTRSSSRKNN
ncbi:dnaJ homolog subfamily C member 9-like [Trichogramma pretiosum]|uniref:dnaJ homolog subfamily C member 9-like n=1 Tax=Trichogramma pretiosum TaxID=7493 RepID=UPI0006C9B424|nr:dnaJ homolog subfamily C member 9-like [Trichogramma pretiosum]